MAHSKQALLLAFLWLTNLLPIVTPSQDIPAFVLRYAPYIHISSNETFFPSDVDKFLEKVVPKRDYETIEGFEGTGWTGQSEKVLNSANLEDLQWNDQDVYLTTKDDPSTSPLWIRSEYGRPDKKGYSDAPCLIILVDKSGPLSPTGDSILDAYYFYFYSWNSGKVVPLAGPQMMGQHVGDWEHSVIRFNSGKPEKVWLGVHSGGVGVDWKDIEKKGGRPVFYSALGTHATYSRAGEHDFTPPVLKPGLLVDYTDSKGPIWDTSLNYRAFWSDPTGEFRKAGRKGGSEGGYDIGFLSFLGRWGDKQYPESDARQVEFFGYAAYVDGPRGPVYKNLFRKDLHTRPAWGNKDLQSLYSSGMSSIFKLYAVMSESDATATLGRLLSWLRKPNDPKVADSLDSLVESINDLGASSTIPALEAAPTDDLTELLREKTQRTYGTGEEDDEERIGKEEINMIEVVEGDPRLRGWHRDEL